MRPKLASFELASKYLIEINQNRIFTNYGPLVKQVESKFADFLGVPATKVVALVNATLAIQGCVQISPARKWAIPNFTFAATAHAVSIAGKEFQLNEVRRSDWKLDLDYIDSTNIGILPVMPFGSPVDAKDYLEWDHVIIDAAASLGSSQNNLDWLKPGHFVIYSLHATKVLGAGEGSIVICGSEENAKMLRAWANFGFISDRKSSFIATNAKMTEFVAAYALAALDQKEIESAEWERALNYKNELMTGIGKANLSDLYPGYRPYWIFDLNNSHNSLVDNLKSNQIESRHWWAAPLSKMPAFSNIKVVGGDSISLSLASNLIGLPMWRDLSNESIERIANIIENND